MRAIVYVDGFNLYYGALRASSHRWLDLASLCQKMLPGDDIVAIRYFTALIQPRPDNPLQAQRQQIYLRALKTIDKLSLHYGHFLTRKVHARLVDPPAAGPPGALVWKTEEKGSDVNLAKHLLVDGFEGRYELAVVISNDGDLKEPVEFVRTELKLPVGVLNPHRRRSYALSPSTLPRGSFYKPIRPAALQASQFLHTLTDDQGIFSKPTDW